MLYLRRHCMLAESSVQISRAEIKLACHSEVTLLLYTVLQDREMFDMKYVVCELRFSARLTDRLLLIRKDMYATYKMPCALLTH